MCENGGLSALSRYLLLTISISFVYSIHNVSSQSKVETYEIKMLKLSLQYRDNWAIDLYDKPTCLKLDACYIIFRLNSLPNETVISIRVQDLDSVDLFACRCKSLIDYVYWNYNWNDIYKNSKLIGDNQTTVNDDHLAWQTEIYKNQKNSKSLLVFAIDGNLGFTFDYDVSIERDYIKHISDFREMLKSVEFNTK